MKAAEAKADLHPALQLHEVENKAKSATLWSIAWLAGKHIVVVLITIILSRLVGPRDYGLISMGATIIILLNTVSDLGLAHATIRNSKITSQQVHNLFWINVLFGFFLAGICVCLSPFVSKFYNEPQLALILVAQSGIFIIRGLSAQTTALAFRNLEHKSLAYVEVVAQLIGGVIAIVSAFQGLGYWSLILQQYFAEGIRTAFLFRISGYRPGPPRLNSGTKELLRFGGVLSVYSLVIYFARNFDNVIVGKYCGADELGYYSRAYFIMMLPSNFTTGALISVIVSTLGFLRDDPKRLQERAAWYIHYITFFSLPLAVGMGLVSHELVRLIYGEKWLAVGDLVFYLSLSAAAQPLYNIHGAFFVAAGKVRQLLLWSVLSTSILLVTFFISVKWRAQGVAIGYSIAMATLLLVPSLFWGLRTLNLPFFQTIRPVWGTVIATAIMMMAVILAGHLLHGSDWRVSLGTKVLVGVFVYSIIGLVLIRPLPSQFLKKIQASIFQKLGIAAKV